MGRTFATTLTVAAALAVGVLLCGCESGREFSFGSFVKSMLPASQESVMQDSVLSSSADVRREAIREMGSWGKVDEGTVTLVGLALLGDRDMMTRVEAARTLGLWGKPEGIPYLSIALAGSVEGTEPNGDSTGGLQLPKTPDRSKFVRRSSAEALSRVQSDEAVQALAQALCADPDADVRVECARALRRHRHVDAARGLLVGLADDDLAVRVTAADSMHFMTGESYGQDIAAWENYLSETETPLEGYGTKIKVRRTSARWLDLSEERKAKIREIFSDLFPLERKEGPFD